MPILSCSDANRNFLKPFGYGTLALPKAGVLPLAMLTKRGSRLAPIGPLGSTFRPGARALPAMSRKRTATISGAQSRALNASIGLDILGGAIGALSGSTLGFKAAYQKASQVEFEFGDVFENSIDFNDLDAYLATTVVDGHIGPALQSLLNDDKVYVITAAVDALQISVKATGQSGVDLGLQVPVVQQLVGGNVAVGTKSGSSSVLTYASTDAPLVIGAQVVRLFFKNGQYQTADLVDAGDVQLVAATQDELPNNNAPEELIEF